MYWKTLIDLDITCNSENELAYLDINGNHWDSPYGCRIPNTLANSFDNITYYTEPDSSLTGRSFYLDSSVNGPYRLVISNGCLDFLKGNPKKSATSTNEFWGLMLDFDSDKFYLAEDTNIETEESTISNITIGNNNYFIEDEFARAQLLSKQDTITDLSAIRSNAQAGADIVPQVNSNTQRIEDLIVSKFPNATPIGQPTVQDGYVSGFSATTYMQFPFEDISRGLPFDIYFSFTTSNDVTTQQNIIDSYFGIAVAISNSKGLMAISTNGTNWESGSIIGSNTISPNTTYYAKVSWTGTEYSTALSTDDKTYVPDMHYSNSNSPHKTAIYIGGSPNIFGPNSAHPFKGTINFRGAKVYLPTLDLTVWEGMADVAVASRANVSLSNLDEAGEAKFTKGNSAYDTIQSYGDIVTHNAIEFALKSEIPSISGLAKDSDVVHKANAENISGVKTFTGGSGGNNVALKAPNGIAIGSLTQTAYSQYATIRLVNDKVNTGSYYIDGNGSVLFRHKTGTKTAEGSANDVMFTMNPETGIKAGWSGTAGKGITDADLHDVLIDAIEYSKLNTTAKDVLGAINEVVTTKQDTLISGTNIKTINGESIVGSGDIEIKGGGGDVFIAEYGVTTFDEIKEAYDSNKTILAKRTSGDLTYIASLSGAYSSQFYFSYSTNEQYSPTVIGCRNTNSWSSNTGRLVPILTGYLETLYTNGSSGYAIWSNGFCIQWGKYTQSSTSTSSVTISLTKKYVDGNFGISLNASRTTNNSSGDPYRYISATTQNSFTIQYTMPQIYWQTFGKLATGEY